MQRCCPIHPKLLILKANIKRNFENETNGFSPICSPANSAQRSSPLIKAAPNSRTSARRQILPSGKGPSPETRGGTQNKATTASMSAGMNRNASRAYCGPLWIGSGPWRSGMATLVPRNQQRMALPSPATAPKMRKIGEVIGIASSVTAPLSVAKAEFRATDENPMNSGSPADNSARTSAEQPVEPLWPASASTA